MLFFITSLILVGTDFILNKPDLKVIQYLHKYINFKYK